MPKFELPTAVQDPIDEGRAVIDAVAARYGDGSQSPNPPGRNTRSRSSCRSRRATTWIGWRTGPSTRPSKPPRLTAVATPKAKKWVSYTRQDAAKLPKKVDAFPQRLP
jgi:hypothetical protein